ncbi:MAG: hypothetical protein NDP13_05520 [Crenarchaeota archaeon]|nr:hypothetical protein [Thermoproteota archaeon]
MELLKALVMFLIGGIIFLASYTTQVKKRRKVKVYGPFLCAYKLDESGALKEVSAKSIPKELIEKLQQKATEIQQKVLDELKPPKKTVQWLYITTLASATYVICAIILLVHSLYYT